MLLDRFARAILVFSTFVWILNRSSFLIDSITEDVNLEPAFRSNIGFETVLFNKRFLALTIDSILINS